NLKLGLGVDHRVVGEQQRLIGLLGVGLLGIGPHIDFAVKDRTGFAVQDSLIQFVARATRHPVVDEGSVMDNLLTARCIEAVERAFPASPRQLSRDFISRPAGTQGDSMRSKRAAPLLAYLKHFEVLVLGLLALELDVIQPSAAAEDDL